MATKTTTEESGQQASARLLRVGELARRTGLTVRTLHHYDTLGLVRPRRRSAAGYRLYGEDDVQRLMRVLTLRRLGLALPEIKACLARPEGSLPAVLRRQAIRLREQLSAQERLLVRLESLAERLEQGGRASLDELIETMEAYAMFEKYYTPEQMAQIEQRGKDVGAERIREVEAAWPKLIGEVQEAMTRGADPASAEVQSLMERWRALLREFTGGDPAIQQSLNRMYASEPSVRQRTGIDPALMDYVQRAMSAK